MTKPEIICPNCSSQRISVRFDDEHFLYGSKGNQVELTARVPVYLCEGCHFEYTDYKAENIRHRAVCRHLGIMAPEQIKDIRLKYGKSQEEFSLNTGIGKASINRWENGLLFQNTAMDNYLYLLSFENNFEKIINRHNLEDIQKNIDEEICELKPLVTKGEEERFLTKVMTPNILKKRENFSLFN